MRDYGRVYSSFWQSPEMRALPEDGRTLALYLLTCPHANLIGCYRMPDAYAADDLQWELGRVRAAFAMLESAAWLSRDAATQWLVVRKYTKWNCLENGNVAKAAHKVFDQVPAGRIKGLVAEALLEFGEHLSEGFAKGLQEAAEPFANPEPEPIQSLNQNQTGTSSAAPPAGDAAAPRKKPRTAKDQPAPTAAVWSAYSDAYERRYGVEPVRNSKVNGQLSSLVGRLGDEAPDVAAFYVGHERRFYADSGHAVDLLLRDAEKLRTEWATGRTVASVPDETPYTRHMRERAAVLAPGVAATRAGQPPTLTVIDNDGTPKLTA